MRIGVLPRPLRGTLALLVLVHVLPLEAQVVRDLTNVCADRLRSQPAMDDAGSVVYSISSSEQFGPNPSCTFQIFRFDPVTGSGSQVTSFDKGVESVSVSDDGAWLAFTSRADLAGSNRDGSPELYVMRSDGTAIVQLTNDPAPNAGQVWYAMIAGSGNRVAFVADTDPLGSNPGRLGQLFVIDRDGSGLVQVTHASSSLGAPYAPSLSDDGTRIVFESSDDLTGGNPTHASQVFAVLADGTGLRQLTHLTTVNTLGAVLSGNGVRIAFARNHQFVDTIEWDGTGLLELAQGARPSITDDGGTIFYDLHLQNPSDTTQIWKIRADGSANTQLTSGAVQYNVNPVVSGNGGRVVFTASFGEYLGGDNPDHGAEEVAIDSSGGNLRQLTRLTRYRDVLTSAITPDGSRVFFASWTDGEEYTDDIYRIQADGTGLTQITHRSSGGIMQVAPSPDGSVVAFSVDDSQHQIYKVQADGTGLLALTPAVNATSLGPVITADGLWVVFEAEGLHAGSVTTGDAFEVFRVRLDGSLLGNITAENRDDDSYAAKKPRVSENTPLPWIVYQSNVNHDGQNPDGSLEILRIRLNGTSLQRLTADPTYASFDPDISGNGNLVVYVSEADPLGTNPEHNHEIFLYDIPAATRRQLTSSSGGDSFKPQITRDGGWVFFHSSAPFFEPNLAGQFEPYRVSVATGVVERLGGTRSGNAQLNDAVSDYDVDARESFMVAADRTGSRAVFTGIGGWSDQNPDLGSDAFLVDFRTKPKLEVGKVAPTLLSWDPEPKPLRYDVIRGDVAALRPGAPGVDLGPVTCIEDDSSDATTRLFEDAEQPAAGHAFFYLHRGSQGVHDGPGSWGAGSGSQERVAGPGACSP